MYLLSLHTWTFVVIFFHAHSLDHTNNNFSQLQLQQNGFLPNNSVSSPHNLQPLIKLSQQQNSKVVQEQKQQEGANKVFTQ
jgi:hypothetical protein